MILLEMPTIMQNDFSGLYDVLDFYFSSLRNILLLPLSLSCRHIQVRSYILLIYILESVASLVRKLCIIACQKRKETKRKENRLVA
jgi:hypothetical protein